MLIVFQVNVFVFSLCFPSLRLLSQIRSLISRGCCPNSGEQYRWSSQTFPSSSEVESLIRFTLMGFQWDWIIHEFENSRILLGSSILVSAFNYPNKPVLAGITEDFEPNIISLTPALIYEHFFGTHLSVGAALSLPLTFSSITWQNNGAANLQKITQTSFAVTTAFEPLMFVRYYF